STNNLLQHCGMNVLDKEPEPDTPAEPDTPSESDRHAGPHARGESARASRRARRQGRARRWLGRGGVAVVAVLALIGAWNSWGWLTAAPEAGHFRSAEGREVYMDAYQESFEALPEPPATHDLRTSHGIVRVYEWSSPRTTGAEPVVLVPGRASGVPMWSENLHHRLRSEEHTSELQSRFDLVCRLLLEKKKKKDKEDIV